MSVPAAAMPPYPVRCGRAGCGKLAAYKVAARWSDGLTHELKTYSFACADCVRAEFADAGRRQKLARLTAGETASAPEVYELAAGRRDRALVRRAELEAPLSEPEA